MIVYNIRSSLSISTVNSGVGAQAYTCEYLLTALCLILCHDDFFEIFFLTVAFKQSLTEQAIDSDTEPPTGLHLLQHLNVCCA